jgi:hypothetical protein
MTPQQFIDLAKTCENRTELLQKLGGYENTVENRRKYLAPLARAANLTSSALTELFVKTPTPTPSV